MSCLAGAFPALSRPITLNVLRWTIALALLLPIAWPQFSGKGEVLRKHFAELVLLAVPSIAIYNTFIYIGMRTSTATNAGLIVGTMPVAILVLGCLAGEERLTTRRTAGLAISFTGVVLVIAKGSPGFGPRAPVLLRRSFHHRIGRLLGCLLHPLTPLCNTSGRVRSARGPVRNRARIVHSVLRLEASRGAHRMVHGNFGSDHLRGHFPLSDSDHLLERRRRASWRGPR